MSGCKFGNAPTFVSFFNPTGWQDAWTLAGTDLTHKADNQDNTEAWTPLSYVGFDSWLLTGQDVALGDIGVSGRTANSNPYFQALDGTEALRLELDTAATHATIALNNLYSGEQPGAFESARIQLLASDGTVVGQQMVLGDEDGWVEVDVSSSSEFAYVVMTAGAYDGGNFAYGSYADANGNALTGLTGGSDFFVDAMLVGYAPASGATVPSPTIADKSLDLAVKPSHLMSAPDKALGGYKDAGAQVNQPLSPDTTQVELEFDFALAASAGQEKTASLGGFKASHVSEDLDKTEVVTKPANLDDVEFYFNDVDAGKSNVNVGVMAAQWHASFAGTEYANALQDAYRETAFDMDAYELQIYDEFQYLMR